MSNTENESQSIEKLTKRYRSLEERKIRNHAVLGETQKQLEELLSQAEELYGTCDLDELQAKLKSMEAENERKRLDYQKQLEQIEQSLAAIEEELAEENASNSATRKAK